MFWKLRKRIWKKVTITFQKSDRIKLELSIESNKKFKELAILFFKKVNKPGLLNDKNIIFYYNNKIIHHNSNELIKDIFNVNQKSNIVLVYDPENIIKILF